MELLDSSENLEAFRLGERAVLEAVYRHYVGEVEKLLRGGFSFVSQGDTIRFRGIREPFRLQEAIQESFIKAFRQSARASYDGSRAYGPYLMTIARHYIIDEYRRHRLESTLFVYLGDVSFDGESEADALGRLSAQQAAPTPETSAWRAQLGEVLSAFVAGLDEVDACILRDHLSGDQTQQGVADALGISRNDVRKRVHLLRERLLRQLKSDGIIAHLDAADALRAATTLIVFGVVP